MKAKFMVFLVLLMLIVLLFVLMSFAFSSEQQLSQQSKKTKVYDCERLMKYTIDSTPVQTKAKAIERYNEYPPLHPERFRRKMKILWGIDINDYPQDALIWFGPGFKLSLCNQIIIGHYEFRNDDPISVPPPSENTYRDFGKFFLYDEKDSYQRLIQYSREKEKENGVLYSFFDILLTIYNSSMIVSPLLIEYIDSMEYTLTHTLNIFLKYEDRSDSNYSRVSEIKCDQVYLYIKEQELKGRVLRNLEHQTDNMINIGFYIDGGSYAISLHEHICPWHIDTWSRSRAALFSFLLLLENKYQRKYVIQYMSGQLDIYSGFEFEESFRNKIRSNNYYGYTVLREFCENPEREMPTLEKVGTSFKGIINNVDKSLLYLEPFSDSYDIDTISPNETFIAYEMGHDDYYFVEVVKPVESPIAGPDGYAMILDRTETVYGYMKKSEVREYTDTDTLSQTVTTGKSKQGIINDPDGYVNIRKEMNAQSEILGKIVKNEIFTYWETVGSNWYAVKTQDGILGYVHKDCIREKLNTGGWVILDDD